MVLEKASKFNGLQQRKDLGKKQQKRSLAFRLPKPTKAQLHQTNSND